jgi:hypothetical protein
MQNALVADFNAGAGGLVPGEVVIVDTAADLSVKRPTQIGEKNVVGVVVVGTDANNIVKVAIGGIFTVKVSNATTRGKYLRTSSSPAGNAVSGNATIGGGDFALALTNADANGEVKAVFITARTY